MDDMKIKARVAQIEQQSIVDYDVAEKSKQQWFEVLAALNEMTSIGLDGAVKKQ